MHHDKKSSDSDNNDNSYTDDRGKYHKDDDYHDQDQQQEERYENDPDIPLDKEDINKGIDRSYKKNSKGYYIWSHAWVELFLCLLYFIVFLLTDCCLFNERAQ